MTKVASYLFDRKNQTKEITWFRNALYLFIIYKVLLYALHFNSLFSNERFIYQSAKKVNVLVDTVFILNNYYSSWLVIVFIFSVFLLAVLGLLKKSNYLSNFLLWLLILNIFNFVYPTLTAGDNLLNQLLFFNIFFAPNHNSGNILTNQIRNVFHNTSLIGIKIQICISYFVAALFKIMDDSWMNGTAIYQTFRVPEYSNEILASIPYSVCMALTYVTIFYQLSFSVLVWFRPFKIYLFSFGVLQHLIIAFGMGLFSFGLIMMICYILFLKYDSSYKADIGN